MTETQVGGVRIARILLVEDDPDDVEITRRAFERAKIGNQLTVVDNGQAALDFLYQNCSAHHDDPGTDMVLLDLEMPKLDGRAVLREIWGDRRLRHIPVIVLTASEREDDLIQSYKGGAVAFLRKPVSVERLLTAVGDLSDYRLYIARLSE
ncbi:MAG: response regulator [Candidatus Binatia bacterium]